MSHGLTRLTVEDKGKTLFGDLGDRLDRTTLNGEIHEYRRRWEVVVPQTVMHHLIVPNAFTGFSIDGH